MSRAVQARTGVRSIPVLDFVPDWVIRARLGAARPSGQPKSTCTVFLEGGVSRYLPLPGVFENLRFKEIQDLVPNETFGIASTQKQSAVLLSYRIEGADFSGIIPDPGFRTVHLRAPAVAEGGEYLPDERARQRFLSYPDTTLSVPVDATGRRYLAGVVEEITSGRRNGAADFARRACEHLARRHDYALGVSLPASDQPSDPAVRWLESGLPGHCEFFAAGFTLLSRTAGYPTRVVTGFKGGTWNAYENYYMVRNSDAHAWCEIYDPEAGAWLRVDPTPGGGGVVDQAEPAQVTSPAVDHSFAAYADSLRMMWYRRIVSFDQRSQRQFMLDLRHMAAAATTWITVFFETFWAEFMIWLRSPWTWESRGDLLLVLIVVLVVAVLMRRFGIGTSDVLEWFRTGEQPTRRRAGELLRRMRRRAESPRPPRWDPDEAEAVAAQLEIIRFAKSERWPDALRVFRTARRLL
jgi:transglutaminase-like putative cysteine protease